MVSLIRRGQTRNYDSSALVTIFQLFVNAKRGSLGINSNQWTAWLCSEVLFCQVRVAPLGRTTTIAFQVSNTRGPECNRNWSKH